jgi:hypothetical protein
MCAFDDEQQPLDDKLCGQSVSQPASMQESATKRSTLKLPMMPEVRLQDCYGDPKHVLQGTTCQALYWTDYEITGGKQD